VPVFPLPNAVLFPHTTLPLRIFEPRYRRMVKDVLAGERWIAVALLRGGDAAETDPPAFHEVAGAGRLVRSSRLSGGDYHVTLEGRVRVRLREIPSSHPYRLAEVEPLAESEGWLTGREGASRLARILEAALRSGLLEASSSSTRMPRSATRRAALVNLLASTVLADPPERQEMLAADLPERSRLLLRQLQVAAGLLDALDRYPRPDDPRNN